MIERSDTDPLYCIRMYECMMDVSMRQRKVIQVPIYCGHGYVVRSEAPKMFARAATMAICY
jgi:hypothetical protein